MDNAGLTATCAVTITAVDTERPTIVCPLNISVSTSPGRCDANVSLVQPSTADNCAAGPAVLTGGRAVNPFPRGTTLQHYHVADNSNNNNTCSYAIVVSDTETPVIACAPAVTRPNDLGVCGAVINLTAPTHSDNCIVTTLTQTRGINTTFFVVGATLQAFDVVDSSGLHANCSTLVTVTDNEPPTLLVTNATVSLSVLGTATITASTFNNGTRDNCGILSLAANRSTLSCSDVGTSPILFTATDTSNISVTRVVYLTVVDTTPPTALAHPVSVTLNSSGSGGLLISDVDNGSNDACGIVASKLSQSVFTCMDVGNRGLNLTVSDPSNNTATALLNATVIDNTPPTISVLSSLAVILNSSGQAQLKPNALDTGSTDACSIAGFTLDQTIFTCADLARVPSAAERILYYTVTGGQAVSNATYVVRTTVRDPSNNTASGITALLVLDRTPPIVRVTNNSVYINSTGYARLTPAMFDNHSSDECGSVTLSVSPSIVNFSHVGVVSITLTATDASGNSAQATTYLLVTRQYLFLLVPPSPLSLVVDTPQGSQLLAANYTVFGPPLTVTFSLSGPSASLFFIDVNGTVTLAGDAWLSVQSGQTLTINITVTDGGPNTDSAIITVAVLQPALATLSLPETFYTALIAASTANGTTLDLTNRAGLTASLVPVLAYPSAINSPVFVVSNPLFAVVNMSSTPYLILNGILTQSYYDLTIFVSLFGLSRINTTVHVTITVTTQTLAAPVLRPLYSFFVDFDRPAGTAIASLAVNSSGTATLTYSLVLAPGVSVPVFLHPDTGVLVLYQVLNSSLVGTVFSFNFSVSNGAFTSVAKMTLGVTASSTCASVVCNKLCYVAGTCRAGQCYYTGITNSSTSCRTTTACACPASTSDNINWPAAVCGDTVVVACGTNLSGAAYRTCSATPNGLSGIFGAPNYTQCVSLSLQSLVATANLTDRCLM